MAWELIFGPAMTPRAARSLRAMPLIALLLPCPTPLAAQVDACPEGIVVTGVADDARPERSPDVLLWARVRIDELMFDEVGSVRTRLLGCPVLDTLRSTVRTNLPSPVRAGITYSNVELSAELGLWLDAACVTEALRGAVEPGAGLRPLDRCLRARAPTTDSVPPRPGGRP